MILETLAPASLMIRTGMTNDVDRIVSDFDNKVLLVWQMARILVTAVLAGGSFLFGAKELATAFGILAAVGVVDLAIAAHRVANSSLIS